MTAHSKGKEVDLSPCQTRGDIGPGHSLLAGEDFSFSGISGNRNGDRIDLIQRIVRRNCDSVFKLASPHTLDLHTEVAKLGGNIVADLEARMSRAVRGKERADDPRAKGRAKDPRGKGHYNDPLDVWTMDILEWTERQSLSPSASSRYKDNLSTSRVEADYVAPLFEAFLLFVAHHVQEHLAKRNATGLLRPEDCRLILPISNKDVETEDSDSGADSACHVNPADYVNSADFVNVECGLFPIRSAVERRAAPAPPHLIVADVEIVRYEDDYNEAELRLATKTKALFFNQHNRRFAWGLTVCPRSIRAYVFGPDDIWASTEMDVTTTEGRQTFISLLVAWSLCSVDRLGFDPTIRYEIDPASGNTYLEIDVHNIDASTGQVESQTYYSQQCVGAADCLTGRHVRYFTASTTRESMDKPAFLIKDVWATLDSNSASGDRESTFLNVLHAEFDKSSEFGGRFSQILSTGPVHISHGDTFVADSTATAFAGLPNVSQVRQHRRTVVQWAGKMISAADNPSQVVVAVADVMAALNAAYDKCKIIHGNISDRAILIQETADGVKGVLADFDYASYAGDSAVETPELMLFKSIRSLENPRAIRTSLDDRESLLYLICWLGTFGVNEAQRREFAARYREGGVGKISILGWTEGNAADIAECKRTHMTSEFAFGTYVLSKMPPDSPLRPLALDIYKALFNYPGSYGTTQIMDDQLAQVKDPVIATALRALPSINGKRDAYMLRDAFVGAIIRNPVDVLAAQKHLTRPAQESSVSNLVLSATTPLKLSLSKKKHYVDEPAVAGPSKRLRP